MFNADICFPTLIYSLDKPEFLDPVRAATRDFLAHSEQHDPLNEIHPVRMTEHMEHDSRVVGFADFVRESAWKLLLEQGYDLRGMTIYFSDLWCHEHHKGSDMAQHVHAGGTQMTGFYFIDVPDTTSVATFFDPRAGKVQGQLDELDSRKVTYASPAFHFAPRSGLLVMTNAWLPHAFTRHPSDEPIRFIHFNLKLSEANGAVKQEENTEVVG